MGRAGRVGWAAVPAAPSIVPGPQYDWRKAPPSAPRPAGPTLPRCPEIDCVRHLLPPGVIALAELRAAEAQVGAERVLIARGLISEEAYVAALAASLGIAFEPLDDKPRRECPLSDDRLIEAATTGLLPLVAGNDVDIVVAPRLVDSRRLVAVARSGADVARRIRLTSTARLQGFVAHYGAEAIERQAIDGLRDRHPELSASSGRRRHLTVAILATATALAAIAASGAALTVVEVALGSVFLAWTGLRLFGLFSERFVRRQPRSFTDDGLPIYTIVVALYREAAAVNDLVAALRRLNYPPEKLDIKLALEPDDEETREAVARLKLGPPFEVVIAPENGPRTKPKALNAALPFVRGLLSPSTTPRTGRSPINSASRWKLSSPATGGWPAYRQGSPSTTPLIPGLRACSPPNTPGCSMCSCRACRRGGCRCRSAGRRTISAPPCCGGSAPGTPTT
jgi:hypothetical protein